MCKVLVIENDESISSMILMKLHLEGYSVKAASTEYEAIFNVVVWEPDVIICDLLLGKMTGLELDREIRKVSKAPVIATSASDEMRVHARKSGLFAAVLEKPFDWAEFDREVRYACAAS